MQTLAERASWAHGLFFFHHVHAASKQAATVYSHSTVSHDGVQGFGAALLIPRCLSLSSVPPYICICQCLTST